MTVALPGIERIRCEYEAGRTIATCLFENGAVHRYRETKFGSTVSETFAPDADETPTREEVVYGGEDGKLPAALALIHALEAYGCYRSGEVETPPERADLDGTRGYWPSFEIVAGHTDSADGEGGQQ